MGRTSTPKYRVEVSDGKQMSLMTWGGKPTNKRLEEWVISYGKSFEHGEVNAHVSYSLGYIPYPVYARIVDQATERVVAIWEAPKFMVW